MLQCASETVCIYRAVCEKACTVDTLSAEAETLNNAAHRAGLPLLHLLRQVGRNADDAMC